MLGGRGLEGLDGHGDGDPEEDAGAGCDGDERVEHRGDAGKADRSDGEGIEQGVDPARAHGLPAGVADVDGRREAGAEEAAGNRAEAVDDERAGGGVGVAPGFCGFEVLQRAGEVEEAHGDDDGQVREPGARLEGLNDEGPGDSGVAGVERGIGGGGGDGLCGAEVGRLVEQPAEAGEGVEECQRPGGDRADEEGDEAGRQPQRHACSAEVAGQEDQQREEADEGIGDDADEEVETDEGQGDAGDG